MVNPQENNKNKKSNYGRNIGAMDTPFFVKAGMSDVVYMLPTLEYVSIGKVIGLFWTMIVQHDMVHKANVDMCIDISLSSGSDTHWIVVSLFALDDEYGIPTKIRLVSYEYSVADVRNIRSLMMLITSKLTRGYFNTGCEDTDYQLMYYPDKVGNAIHVESTMVKNWNPRELFTAVSDKERTDPIRIAKITFRDPHRNAKWWQRLAWHMTMKDPNSISSRNMKVSVLQAE